MPAPVPPSELRARFSAALSDMYRAEVPQYGALIALVDAVNEETLAADPALARSLDATGERSRIGGERHGAIRLGTATELAQIGRAFRLLGMEPVGYYDLAAAGVPVHSTAFRPTAAAALAASPFRVFTSLLRLDLIADAGLRAEAQAILARREILTEEARLLIESAEANGGLAEGDAERFLPALLETFRWHGRAEIPIDLYAALLGSHRLVADVVSFPGPHINHLTPRTLDIDAAQARMAAIGLGPKDAIEGPPRRTCPILLRQTSFKALGEDVRFLDGSKGRHTARFGEIEQRGAALTREGRARYDRMLAGTATSADALPDDWERLRQEGLAFFRYAPGEHGSAGSPPSDLDTAIANGWIVASPITYEDFLPVSAAGIFQSNLGDEARAGYLAGGEQAAFEAALGCQVLDEFALYAAEEATSLRATEQVLGWAEHTLATAQGART